jgi:hypothetical protein
MMMVFFMDITSFRLGFVIPSVSFLTSEERADGRIPLDKRTRAALIQKDELLRNKSTAKRGGGKADVEMKGFRPGEGELFQIR